MTISLANSSMQDVFEVASVTHLSGNNWLVKGRCLETVRINDTIYTAVGRKLVLIHKGEDTYYEIVNSNAHPESYPFVVTAISTYGRDIDQLGGGLTGTISINGSESSAIMHTKYLIKL